MSEEVDGSRLIYVKQKVETKNSSVMDPMENISEKSENTREQTIDKIESSGSIVLIPDSSDAEMINLDESFNSNSLQTRGLERSYGLSTPRSLECLTPVEEVLATKREVGVVKNYKPTKEDAKIVPLEDTGHDGSKETVKIGDNDDGDDDDNYANDNNDNGDDNVDDYGIDENNILCGIKVNEDNDKVVDDENFDKYKRQSITPDINDDDDDNDNDDDESDKTSENKGIINPKSTPYKAGKLEIQHLESDLTGFLREKRGSIEALSTRMSSSESIVSGNKSMQNYKNTEKMEAKFDSFQKFDKNNFVDSSYTRLQTPADHKFDKMAQPALSAREDSEQVETSSKEFLSTQSSPFRSLDNLSRSNLSLFDPNEKQKAKYRFGFKYESNLSKVAINRTQYLREQKSQSKIPQKVSQIKGTPYSKKNSNKDLNKDWSKPQKYSKHDASPTPSNTSASSKHNNTNLIRKTKSHNTLTPSSKTTAKDDTLSTTSSSLSRPIREIDYLFKLFSHKEQLNNRLLEMARSGEWSNLDKTLRSIERNNKDIQVADEDTGVTLLMLAAKENKIFLMEKLLESSVDINARAKDGRTALHFSSMYGRDDGLRLLMKNKADPNLFGGSNEQLPLHMASHRTYYGANLMAQALLRTRKEARLAKDKNGYIPLHIAVSAKNVATCKELLNQYPHEQVTCPLPNLDTVLHCACKLKDFDMATVLLDHKADVDAQNGEGQTPLHVSVMVNSMPLVKLLHIYGASFDLKDTDEKTPLHLATENGNIQIVEYLSETLKADITGRTKDGDTLVHLAASSGHPDIALVFIKRGVPIHMPNKFGATCLHAAAKRGHSGVIQSLILKGAKVDRSSKDDRTPLHVAAEYCNSSAVETLIGYGASVDVKGGKRQETPLHMASGKIGSEECVEMLLKSGADVNAVQENLETPLHIAANNENLKVMEILLKHGADMTLLSKNGESPLHLSVRSCHFDSINFLLTKYSMKQPLNNLSVYVNLPNEEGETSLHYASEMAKCRIHYNNEDVDIVILLLKNGGDVNLQTKTTSETPIHYCAKSGNHEIAQAIFHYLGAAKTSSSINKISSDGSSGLLVACEQGHLETVKVFLSHNARVDVFEEQGKAPIHLATENGHFEVVEELIKHRAYAGAKTKLGLTPLHFAAQNGHARLTIFLADKHKTSMEAVTLDRQTPLHLAAQNGQKAVVSCLLRMRANAEARNNKGQTALHLAAENDHSDVVKMLLKFKPDLVASANSDGMTCAHIAASKGRTAVVEELMRFDKEAVLTAKNKTNESTPLQLAVIGGHVNVVQSLMSAGASATEENSDGMSALLLAAQYGHKQILYILKDLVPLDIVSQKTGFTALHVASKYGQQEFVRELLNHVNYDLLTSEPQNDVMKVLLDVNADYGFTALHLAAEFGHERLVRFLLNSTKMLSDARSTIQGFTALHLAASSGHTDVASLLLSKLSVLLSAKDRKGRLPLHLAAYNGRLSMVTLLLGQGTDVDADDQNGWTSLHYASKAGCLEVVQLLVSTGSNTKFVTKDGKPAASLAASASHTHVLSYLLRQDIDTRHFLEDDKFAFDLMELGKLYDQQPVAEFILASRVPAETSAKLSKIFRQLSVKEKERARDLEEAAKYCDQLALELTAIACNIVNAGTLLNAIEDKEVTFLDLLIDCEQKEVIAYPTIQTYLSEVWTGYLSEWSSSRMLVLLLCMLLCPPFWILISLPLDIKISKIPVVKFMSHLVSHIYLIIIFVICTVYPTFNLWDASHRAPSWSEWLLLIWLSGLIVEQLTNNETPSGLGWLRLFLLGVSTVAVLFEIAAYIHVDEDYRGVLVYIRNQWFGLSMLMAFVLMMEFLSFHHLFGPWAIIIRELMKDLLRFIVVLAIFMFGFTFQISAVYMPVFRTTNNTDPGPCNQVTPPEDAVTTILSPKLTFEMLFFALFGLIDMGNLPCLSNQPWWSIYLLKSIIGVFMLITFIMLVNLLVAMMTDTYADIQAQSDVEWKFGRAKLFRNMNKTSSAPAPIILITKLITYIAILHRFRAAGCVYNTQPFVNEIEGLDNDVTNNKPIEVLNQSVEEDSRSRGCCSPCCKKNIIAGGRRQLLMAKSPHDRLFEILNWKIVSEKYLSMTKKNSTGDDEEVR